MILKSKVARLLRDNPDLRDSDKWLMMAVWREQGLTLTEEQERRFMDVSTAESITRVRRELKGDYPASKEVSEKRYQLFKQNRDNYSRAVRAPESFLRQYGERYE